MMCLFLNPNCFVLTIINIFQKSLLRFKNIFLFDIKQDQINAVCSSDAFLLAFLTGQSMDVFNKISCKRLFDKVHNNICDN